jgi:hypothetical protein
MVGLYWENAFPPVQLIEVPNLILHDDPKWKPKQRPNKKAMVKHGDMQMEVGPGKVDFVSDEAFKTRMDGDDMKMEAELVGATYNNEVD